MQRSYRWITLEGHGHEHLEIDQDENGIVARGVVLAPDAGPLYTGTLFGCSYTIGCDARWRVRMVALWVTNGARLLLRADGAGHWFDGDGAPLPVLDGCIDVDLSCTPFSNTLPIRRLGGALRTRRQIDLAYIALPQATVQRASQAYTELGAGRYLFESPADGFEAGIAVDADGLVLDYPGLFTRA